MKKRTNNLKLLEDKISLQNPYAHEQDIDYTAVSENDLKELKKRIKFDSQASSSKSLESNIKTTNNPLEYKRPPKTSNSGNPYKSIGENAPLIKQAKTEIQFDGEISEIESKARDLQNQIWKNRHSIWKNNVPLDPVEMLDPAVAFETLGYDFDVYESLDDFANGSDLKVAGLIDQSRKKAYISNTYTQTEQRFTSAHELGHAVLHPNSIGLHRDRAIDGGPVNVSKSKTEKEADDFAKFYIMPRNLVIRRFEAIFGTQNFMLDENTAFALDPKNRENLLSRHLTIREISRILASTQYYNGRHVVSLSEQFKVSVEAMAIRLEELKLVS